MASLALALFSSAFKMKLKRNNPNVFRLWGRVSCGLWEFLLVFLFRYSQTSTSTSEMHYNMKIFVQQSSTNDHLLCREGVWEYTTWIFLLWLQNLTSKEEFLFFNPPRGFWRSLGQRSHFICLDNFVDFLYVLINNLSFFKNPLPSSFGLFTICIYKAQPLILTWR